MELSHSAQLEDKQRENAEMLAAVRKDLAVIEQNYNDHIARMNER